MLVRFSTGDQREAVLHMDAAIVSMLNSHTIFAQQAEGIVFGATKSLSELANVIQEIAGILEDYVPYLIYMSAVIKISGDLSRSSKEYREVCCCNGWWDVIGGAGREPCGKANRRQLPRGRFIPVSTSPTDSRVTVALSF